MTSSTVSCFVRGRPGARLCELSYLGATSLLYQRRTVSGVTMPANSARAVRPQSLAFDGESAALVIGQPDPALTEPLSQDAVLLLEVADHVLLGSGLASDHAQLRTSLL